MFNRWSERLRTKHEKWTEITCAFLISPTCSNHGKHREDNNLDSRHENEVGNLKNVTQSQVSRCLDDCTNRNAMLLTAERGGSENKVKEDAEKNVWLFSLDELVFGDYLKFKTITNN